MGLHVSVGVALDSRFIWNQSLNQQTAPTALDALPLGTVYSCSVQEALPLWQEISGHQIIDMLNTGIKPTPMLDPPNWCLYYHPLEYLDWWHTVEKPNMLA